MNTTAMFLCMACSLSTAQKDDVVYKGPKLLVRKQSYHFDNRENFHRVLLYNRINVGFNFTRPAKAEDRGDPARDYSRLATTYFHREGPLGVVMEKYNWFPGQPNTYSADVRLPLSLIGSGGLDPCGQLGQLITLWSEPPIGVIDIDVGSMASYARLGQPIDFYEPVQAMVKMSFPDEGKAPLFHFVPDALARGARARMFEGEPRAAIEKHAGDGFYQVIVVNTYKLPVVTVHKDLMTKEGMSLLMSKTRADGILCYHTSSRFYDLVPIIASVAKELKYECLVGFDLNDDYQKGHFTSEWVMVARDKKHLAHLKPPPNYEQALRNKGRIGERFWSAPALTDAKYVWTDKGENSFRGLYRASPEVAGLHDLFSQLEESLPFGNTYSYTRPIHNAFDAWARRSAEIQNREPPKKKN